MSQGEGEGVRKVAKSFTYYLNSSFLSLSLSSTLFPIKFNIQQRKMDKTPYIKKWTLTWKKLWIKNTTMITPDLVLLMRFASSVLHCFSFSSWYCRAVFLNLFWFQVPVKCFLKSFVPVNICFVVICPGNRYYSSLFTEQYLICMPLLMHFSSL